MTPLYIYAFLRRSGMPKLQALMKTLRVIARGF
jgi:hypothetical protein